MTLHTTPLDSAHDALGARMVPFAGWRMPVQYVGILEEATLVRTKAGLFDLSHMGRVRVTGRDAEAFLQRLQTNDASTLQKGQIRYSMILDEQGRTQDDILVYRDSVDDGAYFLVINASNTARDLAIMTATAKAFPHASVVDQTHELGMFAIQGPLSQEITQKICDADLASLKYYYWRRAKVAGTPVEISRTGYTGEDGFEVYAPNARIPALWSAFLAAGKDKGLLPAGLGARDTLRLEAGMPLYGHEIDETTNPLEAGLAWAVKFTHEFTGRKALEAVQAKGGTGRRLVGLTTESKRVPRQGYEVLGDGKPIGKVASGAVSPTLQTHIATAYVSDAFAEPGTAIEFAIKDKREPAVVRALPFYKRTKK
jgi:glycine cleavage system T protein (aminomethyltransferase)